MNHGGLRELALFAGAGGGILGGALLGWRTVCAVELNPYCRSVLMQRQDDGHLPPFPIWDDVCTFDGRPWRGLVDVVSGGFPCQDISSAGKRAGIDGERSGLWREMARIIGEVQPRCALIENSPNLRTRGLGRVLQDLASLGYDARWGVFGADAVGAPHRRRRMWIVAHANNHRERTEPRHDEVALPSAVGGSHGEWLPADSYGESLRRQPRRGGRENRPCPSKPGGPDWWPMDLVQGVDDGVAHRMDRVRATGNGQVPAVVRLAWETLLGW